MADLDTAGIALDERCVDAPLETTMLVATPIAIREAIAALT